MKKIGPIFKQGFFRNAYLISSSKFILFIRRLELKKKTNFEASDFLAIFSTYQTLSDLFEGWEKNICPIFKQVIFSYIQYQTRSLSDLFKGSNEKICQIFNQVFFNNFL